VLDRDLELSRASDASLRLAWPGGCSRENTRRVRGAVEALRRQRLPGVRDLHPAYATVLVVFDPLATTATDLERRIADVLAATAPWPASAERQVEIPVCYEEACAPDLAEVAAHTGLSPIEVVRTHAAADYFVAFVGFVPGFAYLGGLPAELATPRLAAPRTRVPRGSVAIGGSQTGIYPLVTPGGWRIIGRTPLELFRADREPPALLAPGDRVRFTPIRFDATPWAAST
jgi:KipI family sensor histidine kinase inhibitor